MDKEIMKVIGISGPTGAGKNFLVSHATRMLGLRTVTMLTTRAARPSDQEDKKPVTLEEFNSYERSELIGSHRDPTTGTSYAYRLSDFQMGNSIIELSPMQQKGVPQELEESGLDMRMVGWVGLVAEEEYLKHNIEQRETMPLDDVEKRMKRSREFMEKLHELHKTGEVTDIFTVGWKNRKTMRTEFADLVSSILRR